MTTLIKNGRIITATDDYTADVFIDGETVKMIGKDLPVKADKTLDATGKLVIPGSIDPRARPWGIRPRPTLLRARPRLRDGERRRGRGPWDPRS